MKFSIEKAALGKAVAQAQSVDDGIEPALIRGASGDVERQSDVLERGQGGHQIEGLEHETDSVPS